MKSVKLGIVGIGNMGSAHARSLLAGKVPGLELGAVADIDPAKRDAFPEVPFFDSADALIDSGEVEAVLVATPHYDHPPIGAKALKAGLHTLVEKPIAAHKADAAKLIAAAEGRKAVFAAMFNQRTDPYYRKIKSLIDEGELGEIRRVSWIITTWFRTDAYYASGGWRATWAGEGGGVLLNQCPHNLDLYQWLFGMPSKARGFCRLGRYHDIEVEDDVTAYLEHPNGATGVFVTTTGEAPGTNRLEVVGEQGKLVYEDNALVFHRNRVGMSAFSASATGSFARPESWRIELPVPGGHGEQHIGILKNFVERIRDPKTELIAPAQEGIRSVELANAMLFSSLKGKPVDLPMNAAAYARQLRALIRDAKPREPKRKAAKSKSAAGDDFAQSFQ